MEIEQHICREEGGTIKGTSIHLSGDEVCMAIETWLVAHGVHIRGSRTITVNRDLCDCGNVFVDPSGRVIANDPRQPRRDSGVGLHAVVGTEV